MLHAVERSVSSCKKFFRRVAVFGKGCRSGACRESGLFGFSRHFFVDSCDDPRCDVRAGFGKHDGEFVAAVTCRCVDRAAVIAENLAEADQGAASCEMAVTIIDLLEAVHIEQDDTEWTLRAARTIEFRFDYAEQSAVIRETRER